MYIVIYLTPSLTEVGFTPVDAKNNIMSKK